MATNERTRIQGLSSSNHISRVILEQNGGSGGGLSTNLVGYGGDKRCWNAVGGPRICRSVQLSDTEQIVLEKSGKPERLTDDGNAWRRESGACRTCGTASVDGWKGVQPTNNAAAVWKWDFLRKSVKLSHQIIRVDPLISHEYSSLKTPFNFHLITLFFPYKNWLSTILDRYPKVVKPIPHFPPTDQCGTNRSVTVGNCLAATLIFKISIKNILKVKNRFL